MLPFVLVLLLATSALAAPSVSVNQYGINEIAPARDPGGRCTGVTVSNAWEMVDGADTSIHIQTILQILQDLANQPDNYSKAQAIAQTIAMLGQLAYGVPGTACDAASAINDYASGGTGSSYIGVLRASIDAIVTLAVNPNSLRYTTGPCGRCSGSGRTYQFEAAWDGILNKASPYTIGLVNEEYCAAKRLYNAFNVRSNNVGAAATAAALPSVVNACKVALDPLVAFLRQVSTGNNYAAAVASAAAAKNALRG